MTSLPTSDTALRPVSAIIQTSSPSSSDQSSGAFSAVPKRAATALTLNDEIRLLREEKAEIVERLGPHSSYYYIVDLTRDINKLERKRRQEARRIPDGYDFQI